MNDRELLEAAAKAAGIDAHWGDGWQADMMFRAVPRPSSPLVANVEWNPLADDGDAVRLMADLGLSCVFDRDVGAVYVSANGGDIATMERDDGDIVAAWRRAVVRAAAEIGKGMK